MPKKVLVYTVSLEDVDRKPPHAWALGSPQKYIVLASEISEEMILGDVMQYRALS